jgi:hypothetical protein
MAIVRKELVQPNPRPKSITEILQEHTQVQAALDRGFYRAVLKHRAGNVPMVFMRDGKIVDVDANEIPIPDDILAEISKP